MARRRRQNAFKRLMAAAIVLALVAIATYRGAHYLHDRSVNRRVEAHRELIWKYAQANSLPPELVFSMVRAESGGDARALSPKGAKGLMQIMPAAESDVLTRHRWERGDLFDPDYNLKTGAAYLRMLANQFDDDYELSVAAYHMGARAVKNLRAANPGLSSRELIQKRANRTTAAYVRNVFGR